MKSRSRGYKLDSKTSCHPGNTERGLQEDYFTIWAFAQGSVQMFGWFYFIFLHFLYFYINFVTPFTLFQCNAPKIHISDQCHIFMSLLPHSALRLESVCYVLTGSLSFSPTSGSTLACTGASTPGWTAGPKSTSPATWPPTPASGWWEKSRKACCRAPPPASPKSSTISA